MKERLIHERNCSLAVLDAATRMKKREDQLRRTRRDLRASCEVH